MLDKVIRELTAKDNNEQTMSEDVLVWTKRIEMQRAQEAILNNITESQNLTKLNWLKIKKTKWDLETTHPMYHKQPCRYCAGNHVPRQCPAYEKCAPDAGKWATSRRYAAVTGITWCMKWKWRWHRDHKKK